MNSAVFNDVMCAHRSFMDNELEMEFALPSTIDDEAIECSIELAEEMNILYEKGGRVSCVLCVYMYTIFKDVLLLKVLCKRNIDCTVL